MQGNTLTISSVFGTGWNCFKARPLFWIGIIILYVLTSLIINVASAIIPELVARSSGSVELGYVFVFVLTILTIYVSTRVAIGLVWMGLGTVDGKTMKIEDLFAKPHLFWRFLFATLLYQIMCLVGFLLLIVPGIYLSIRFFPLSYVIIERETGILDGFRQAQRLTERSRGKMFLYGLLAGVTLAIVFFALMTGVKFLALLLGGIEPVLMPIGMSLAMLIAVPVLLLSWAAMYRALRNGSLNQAAPV